MKKQYWVYLLASKPNGTLYIGSTSHLVQRVWQHKQALIDGFTKQYDVRQLVWYESHADAYTMVTRERQLKEWRRNWKIRLIEQTNPAWLDLYESIV